MDGWTRVVWKTESAGTDKSVHLFYITEIDDVKPVLSTENNSAPLP